MKSGAHHNKGSHLGNTRSRHLETASVHCRSLMLFIFVQLLKREPALLNAHQVPIAICSCMAIKKPRVSKRKSSETFTRKKPSHPKPVPCMPVLYNIIQSGFKLEVKRQFWTHIYDEIEICWCRAVALTSASIPFVWPSYNDSIAKYMHTIKYS